MGSLSSFAEHLPPNDRLVLVLKEVEKTHKTQNEMKRIIKLVKNEKENILFELKKYEQLFNTYNQLQKRLTQLLNQNQVLTKHKLDLFKLIHKISQQLKSSSNTDNNSIDNNISTNCNDYKNKDNNIQSNNNKDNQKQSTPLCLTEEPIIDIKVKQTEDLIIPSELRNLPDLPILNRFHINNCGNKFITNSNNSNNSNNNNNNNNNFRQNKNSFNRFKKIDFVYNCTLEQNNRQPIVEYNQKTNNNNNNNNKEKVPNYESNKDSVKEVSKDDNMNKISENGITFCSKESVINNPQNIIDLQNSELQIEFKITEEIDSELKEDNSATDDVRSLTSNDNELHDNMESLSDTKAVQTQEERALKSKSQTYGNSHISQLRKNLKDSEDEHLFEEISLKKFPKHTIDKKEVIKSIKRRPLKTDLDFKPKKIQSFISSVSMGSKSRTDSQNSHKRDKSRRSDKKHEKTVRRSKESRSKDKDKDKRDGKKRKDRHRHESKSDVTKAMKSTVKSTVEVMEKIKSNESIPKNIENSESIVTDAETNNNHIQKEHILDSNTSLDASQVMLNRRSRRERLTFKLERNRNFELRPNQTMPDDSCSLTSEEVYNKNIELQKKIREDLLLKKEERRKSRAIELKSNAQMKAMPNESSINIDSNSGLISQTHENTKQISDVFNKPLEAQKQININRISSKSNVNNKPLVSKVINVDNYGTKLITKSQIGLNELILNDASKESNDTNDVSISNLISAVNEPKNASKDNQIINDYNQTQKTLINNKNSLNESNNNKKIIVINRKRLLLSSSDSNNSKASMNDSTCHSSEQQSKRRNNSNPELTTNQSKPNQNKIHTNHRNDKRVVLKR